MSDQPKTDLQRLQEYLDGRLSPEQRRAFEARLEREPSLRLELESARDLRAALRDDEPELSPGFYTRARARFEESAPEEQRWSFRLLSWETAGVAAAAALATALFLPRLTQEGVPADLGAVETAQKEAITRVESTVTEDSFAPEPSTPPAVEEGVGLEMAAAKEKVGASTPAAPKAEREKKGRRVVADAPEPTPRAPSGFADSEKPEERREKSVAQGKQAQATKSPSEKDDLRAGRDSDLGLSAGPTAGDETSRTRIDRNDDAFRAAAPAEAERAPSTGRLTESASARQVRAENEEWGADPGERAGAPERDLRPVVIELPGGLVEREQLRIVQRVEEWVDLLAGPHRESIEMLGAPSAERRLVLIGSRSGLACDSLAVTSDDNAYRIEPGRLPGTREADGGCALVLPLDGRTVVIADPR